MNEPGPDIDAEYRQLREECGLVARDAALLAVEGPDAVDYLHSQVTNDVEALGVGEGCYACLLDRKGHVQADMRVLRVGDDEVLVVCDRGAAPVLERHLSTYSIGRDVRLVPRDDALVSLIGPATLTVTGLASGDEHATTRERIDGVECLLVTTPSGVDVITPSESAGSVRAELLSRGCESVSERAAEILRVESGRPRFGTDLAGGPMPAEAGLVERSVSFTKGCYIGQEPVARLHYKGRPNRFLRGLRLDGRAEAGDTIRNPERELGTIGSIALSPVEGWIGLAIIRREAEPGQRVEVITGSGPIEAEVVDLPFPIATMEFA